MFINVLFVFLLFGGIIAEDYDCSIVKTSDDRRTDKNKLKIMQYNVEWLFLDYYKSADCPGNGCTWKNKTMALDHLKHVSSVINNVEPDIVNLCEIEGCNELNTLINNTNSKYNGYMIKGTDTSTGQNVGMITKIDPISDLMRTDERYSYPITGSECGYDGNGSTSVSKNYITYFNFNTIKVAFISFHLIAYPMQPDRCSKREAQAKILENEIITQVQNGYEVIAIGDFNDYDEEVLDVNDDEPISKVLDIIKGNNNNIYNLNNVNDMVKKENRFTNWWDKNDNCEATMDEFVLIDHVLVTDKILNYIKDVYIYQLYNESCDRLDSDHYPIIVELDMTSKLNLRGSNKC